MSNKFPGDADTAGTWTTPAYLLCPTPLVLPGGYTLESSGHLYHGALGVLPNPNILTNWSAVQCGL